MALAPGTRLGVFEVTAQIGVGGMGEVYRARDTRLKRDVALKILPETFAADRERLARFKREAQVLASLNHPNIAAIYGFEEGPATLDSARAKEAGHDGSPIHALVLELVEGPTLADRIAQGPIPLDDALPIARQIAEALEAAHDHGIVHRDLKPANIKLRPDATVKVLDFGLAKALEGEPAASGMAPSMSPTITSPAATRLGMILGTAAYMSPEQARGKVVDKRTDVWAFGCVVYEMLTGRRAFEGDEISDVLARIIEREPDFTALSPATPASVLRLLHRCLIKDSRRRLPDVGAARLDIDEALNGSAPAVVPALTARSFPRRAAAVVLVAGLTIGAAIGAIGAWVARAPAAAGLAAFTVETPAASRPDAFALSPDGRQLAFTALDKDGQVKLWLRPLESTAARALPGTERADMPFWSPDSRTVAFFTTNELKRIDVAGGAVQTIAKTSSGGAAGGTWNDQNIILFSRGGNDGILRVAAGGGEAEQLTTIDTSGGAGAHLWPAFLPGGRHFLYLKIVGPSIAENSQLMWRALDSADERVVRKMYSKAFYSPTGHLLFSLGGPVVAQPFDASGGTASGDPIQLVGDTLQAASRTSLAFSPAGVLAHRAGGVSAVAQLSWIDRDGKVVATVGAAGDYRNAAIDRAGERVVANAVTPSDVWLFDSRRGTTSRITFDPRNDSDPIFSPDGRWVVFYSSRQPAGIYRKASNGAGAEELVAATGPATYPSDWSPDGRFLLYADNNGKIDLSILPMTGDRKQVPYLATPAIETDGQFSPDGRWIAYTSDETGRAEVFVQDFPSTGAKFQVSVAGGTVPRWERSGRELYFLAPDGRLMSVDVESTPEFRLGIPRPLFQTRLMNLPQAPSHRYGVSPDGTRFMMNVPVGEDALAPITVLLNWQALLNK